MTRKLLAVWCGPLLLAACLRPVPRPPVTTEGLPAFVEAIRDYARPRDVPAAFQHLVDWHAGTATVVLLFSAGGRRACAITPFEVGNVVIGKTYRCRWSAAR